MGGLLACFLYSLYFPVKSLRLTRVGTHECHPTSLLLTLLIFHSDFVPFAILLHLAILTLQNLIAPAGDQSYIVSREERDERRNPAVLAVFLPLNSLVPSAKFAGFHNKYSLYGYNPFLSVLYFLLLAITNSWL